MTEIKRNPVGATQLMVTELGLGTGTLGNLYREVSDKTAEETLDAAWNLGLRYFDTAPFYGLGLSETRVGAALSEYPRDDYVLSTKVGRLLVTSKPAKERYGFINPMPNDIQYDYSYDGVMRSYEQSLNRTQLDRIDILLMHDIGRDTHGKRNDYHFPIAMEGGYRALNELREGGAVSAIGLGVNEVDVCREAMRFGEWDCFLLAGRYTLLEQCDALDFLAACNAAGTSIILGGVYNSGVLATGTKSDKVPYYNYAPAPAEVISRVRKIEAICDCYQVPLTAAALQFPLAHPAVACVIPGMGNPERIGRTIADYNADIPSGYWAALKTEGLLAESCPTPG